MMFVITIIIKIISTKIDVYHNLDIFKIQVNGHDVQNTTHKINKTITTVEDVILLIFNVEVCTTRSFE